MLARGTSINPSSEERDSVETTTTELRVVCFDPFTKTMFRGGVDHLRPCSLGSSWSQEHTNDLVMSVRNILPSPLHANNLHLYCVSSNLILSTWKFPHSPVCFNCPHSNNQKGTFYRGQASAHHTHSAQDIRQFKIKFGFGNQTNVHRY